MSQSHEGDNSKDYIERGGLIPRHRRNIASAEDIGRLIGTVGVVIELAEERGMIDASVFHRLDMEDGRLTAASNRLNESDSYDTEDFLRIIINKRLENSYDGRNGTIFTSEYVLGLNPDNRNIWYSFEAVTLDADNNFPKGKLMPPIIWQNIADGMGVFRGKKSISYMPPSLDSCRDSPSKVMAKVAIIEDLQSSLRLLGPATEDARYPYET